jgi:transcriptional regulator with XRE-family HTH domain
LIERLKILRKTLGLTLEQFGERLGVSKSAASLWESGNRKLSEPTIKLICKEFKVSERWLLEGKGDMFAHDMTEKLDDLAAAHSLGSDQRVLIERFIKLSPEARQAVIRYVSDVVDQIRDGCVQEPDQDSIPDMSPDELHDELDRHIALEKGEKSGVC